MKYGKSLIFICLLICLFTMASAVASDANETLSVDETPVDDAIMISEDDNQDTVEIGDGEDDVLSSVEEDVLDAAPPSNAYSVRVSDTTMNYGTSKSVTISITPASGYSYRYYFYFRVYDSNGNQEFDQTFYGTSYSSSKTCTIDGTKLNPGTYTIKLVNYADKKVMDTATLTVKSVPSSAYSVSVSDMTINYGSSDSIKMTISPASSSYYYKYDYYLKIYDSNNVQKVSKRYFSTSSSYSQTYSINANSYSIGDYTIKIINTYDNSVMDTATLSVKSVPSAAYSVSISDNTINYGSSDSIKMTISPASSSYHYRYDYYLKIYDSNNIEKVSKRYYSTSSSYSQTYSLNAYSLSPGDYTVKIINNAEGSLKSYAKLSVIKTEIVTNDVTGNCEQTVQFKAHVTENNAAKSGLNVAFTCNGKQYNVVTDSNGNAVLNIHLKAGTYDITTKYRGITNRNTININSVYVADKYRNVRINSPSAYYKQNKMITYSFEGNLKGNFKIYKGNSLKYAQGFNTNGYTDDYFTFNKHSYTYSLRNLKETGTYNVRIEDIHGKVLAKSTFKITKAPTRAESESYITIGGFKDTIYAYSIDKDGFISKMGGTAKFKINGKTYKAKVKNGVSKVKVKFSSKKKTYKCSVKFSGDKNYKASKTKFKIKVTTLKNPVKIGKYKIKLTSKQYKKLVKAIRKCKSKTINIKTNYKYKVKKPYYKTVKKYRTTKSCKTLYGVSYLPTMEKMWYNGWSKVSEYTFTKKNPQNKYGIGLSAYTYAVTKWVKYTYKKAYKTTSYPVKAKITTGNNWMQKPTVKIYSHGKTLKKGKMSFK